MGKIPGCPDSPRRSSDQSCSLEIGLCYREQAAHISKRFLSPLPDKDTKEVLFLGCLLGEVLGGKGPECAGPLLK